jgi:hypothetical protein
MSRRLLIVFALLLPQFGCSGNPGCGSPGASAACTRVLFIGNSYTYVNDLPTTFASLANSGGRHIETGMLAEGGSTLAAHAASSATATTLASARWNIVVLQEQSEIPSVDQFRQMQMYPAARQLTRMVRDAGAQPMFFLTWAHRDGWPANGISGYAGMQTAIDDGYLAIAAEQHAAVAPVGYAWSTVLGEEADAGLWQDDGVHPTAKGTYLAACVFYAAIFRQSPQGLGYHADLRDDEAARLQTIAADVVLGHPARWGLR